MDFPVGLLTFFAALLLAPPLSMVFDALRSRTQAPEKLYWDVAIPIRYAQLEDCRIRYVRTGQGPVVVLLHTLRTHLDIFEKVIPALSQKFTVLALDLPGHGFSDIPDVDYVPKFFADVVEQFLEQQDLHDVTLAGISIGGSIPLLVAARHNPRVRKVVAINPYDYGAGMGVKRGNFAARVVFTLATIPVIGETIMRFRIPLVERWVMEGGVAQAGALTPEFLKVLWESGVRNGQLRGFLNLLRNAVQWETAVSAYSQVKIPVLLVYGERDWSTPTERSRTAGQIPGATMVTVPEGGHFLSLDQPEAVIQAISWFAAT